MRARHWLFSLLVPVLVTAGLSAQGLSVESDQEILVRLERAWNAAVYKNDVSFVRTVLADEYVATYEDGTRGDKTKELALIGDFNQNVESAIQDDFTVKTYRDTAVVWFTLHLTGLKQGQRVELTLRYTDVWVLRDTRWQCVSSQSTRVSGK